MSTLKVALAAATVALAALGSASVGSAWAGSPVARSINLGNVNGVAYYTEEAGRFRVVATLAQTEGQPIRVETLLAPGQTVVLSTAQEGQLVPTSVEISLQNDDLLVQAVPATN